MKKSHLKVVFLFNSLNLICLIKRFSGLLNIKNHDKLPILLMMPALPTGQAGCRQTGFKQRDNGEPAGH